MYSSNLIVNSPNMAGLFRCKDCHMTFNNQQLLAKHKLKFCVGTTGDPNDLQLRRGLRSTSPPRLISPDDRDDFRRNPNQDQQLRNLAESHGRQMEYLQQRNKDLEKQREDIRRQLEGLGRKSVIPAHDNTDALLQELREQERRNQRNIDELRRELMAMNNQKVNVIEIEKPVYPAPQPAPPPPQQPSPEPKRNFVLPVFYGKSLVAEICAIRQAYLQNGGNDPEVLAQMAQMQAEAQAIEDQMNKEPEKRPREKPKDSFGQLNFLEMENDRLKQELALLQEQNLLAQQRRKSDKEGNKRTLPKYHPRYNTTHVFVLNNKPSKPKYKLIGYLGPGYESQSIQAENTGQTDLDNRSYHSEPAKRPRQKVIKYKATHQTDGSVYIERKENSKRKRPPVVPHLNLRDIVSPGRLHYGENHKFRHQKKIQNGNVMSMPAENATQNPSQVQGDVIPDETKLSQIPEGKESAETQHLPFVNQTQTLVGLETLGQGHILKSKSKPSSRQLPAEAVLARQNTDQEIDSGQYYSSLLPPQQYLGDGPDEQTFQNNGENLNGDFNHSVIPDAHTTDQNGSRSIYGNNHQTSSPTLTENRDFAWQVQRNSSPVY